MCKMDACVKLRKAFKYGPDHGSTMVALHVTCCPRAAAALVPTGAWQCVAEVVHLQKRGFQGQDSTAHVGLPSEPKWLKNIEPKWLKIENVAMAKSLLHRAKLAQDVACWLV